MKNAPKPAPKPEARQPLSPNASAAIVDALLRVMDELAALMETEIKLLEKRDMKALSEILPTKHKLVSTYVANLKNLEMHPEVMKSATDDVRRRLKERGQKLEKATNQNATNFKGAYAATRRIIDNIMAFIREETAPKHAAYGNPRIHGGMVAGAYGASHPSVAVNRTA